MCPTHKFYSSVPKTQHSDISVTVEVNGPITMYIQCENVSPLKSQGAQGGKKKKTPFSNRNLRSISMFLNIHFQHILHKFTDIKVLSVA